MKRPFRAKSVAASLSEPSDSHLKMLLEKANRLKSVSQTIEQYLPTELIGHCKVGNINHNVLTLYADTPSWGNRLRYLSSQLLSQLRASEYPGLVSINIKIRPNLDLL